MPVLLRSASGVRRAVGFLMVSQYRCSRPGPALSSVIEAEAKESEQGKKIRGVESALLLLQDQNKNAILRDSSQRKSNKSARRVNVGDDVG
jgi:hypothetical protein